MGAGRKTETVVLQKKPPPQWNSNTNPYSARNLSKKDLAGVIFGCKHSTYKECMSKQLFGLPAPHFQYVKNVMQGMTLFLFNYSDRKLHGIFEAASAGQMKIDPRAWTLDDEEDTPFPAQVRVKVRMRCLPVTEDQFQPILVKNYRLHDPNFFWFELDASQNEKLISLLSASPVRSSVSSLHPPAKPATSCQLSFAQIVDQGNCSSRMTRLDLHSCTSTGNDTGKQKWEASMDQDAPVKNANGASSFQGKTWSSLFKPEPNSIPKEEHKNSEKSALEVHIPCRNHFNVLGDLSCSELSPDGEKEPFEVLTSKGIATEVGEQVFSSVPNSEFSDSDTVDAMPSLTEIFDQIALAADMLDDGEDTKKVVSDEYLSFVSHMEGASSLSGPHLDGQIELAEASLNAANYGHMTCRPCSEGSNYSAMSGIADLEENAAEDASVLTEANGGATCSPEGILSDMETSDVRTVVTKLVQTIGEMRSLQLIQSKKIQKLEEELVESNRKIEELRDHLGSSAMSLSFSPAHGKKTRFQGFQDSNQRILLVGGFDGFSWLPDLDFYIPSEDVKRSLEPMSSVRSYVSAVTLNYGLYVVDVKAPGITQFLWVVEVELYNLNSNQWVSCPSLNSRRGSLAGVCLSDKIFAIGGGNAAGCLSEVEMLDLNIGKWIFTCSMMQKRFAPAAAQMNGALYVVGGYDGREYLRSMERLDPRECTWTRLVNMTTRRGCHSVAVLNEKLYAVGGFDGYQMVPTVEVFEPRVGSWMTSEPLKRARGYMGTVTLGNNILVIGGTREEHEVLDTVECYSEGEGWQLTDLKSVGKRCFFSAVVV
ncbi:LOW QUALITY PROTEIN: hypothetical protein Cgig2_023038 [Carnegiea gigantea]|uniref:DCD domain-containing protein n=1 Tax=Carnegiea gigantea TaxID=171969 RepID=A0A9Q1K9J9_9CARY|nr:LOW QUALITY PROTEIN: hypothetical protein Cgig2_023038 [Carnegiea gigantea]